MLLGGLGPIPSQAQDVVAASDAFFALSESEKKLVQWSGVGEWSGWQPLYAGGGDSLQLERYEVVLPNPEGFATREQWAAEFTQWPARPVEMWSVWADYYRSMRGLTDRLLGLLIDALDLPLDDLPAWTSRQYSNLCVNHYLAQLEPPAEGQVRQKPHTDHGGLTLLWADGKSGLEACVGPEDTWIPVPLQPDTLLLQAGDLLHLWSRRTIPANNHRVVNPPRGPGITQTDRYSLVFFHHPDLDTMIPGTSGEEPAKSAGEHVMERQRKSYSLT